MALPLSGVLTLVGLLSRYGIPNPRVDAEAAAQSASSTSFIVAQFVGNVLGLTLLIFGLLARYADGLTSTSSGEKKDVRAKKALGQGC